ncbi:MAG TPA: inorganic phosphate transporter, partial [Candidatus Omnitrophota bacterium]|nr:inorganic phosphate transporter [Candidatus Omnitrophota bacterium]
MTLAILVLIILALVFDFLNGFHDSANSIATVVSTRVLSPKYAVLWAAFFNLLAYFFFGLHVANTIGRGIIDINIIDKTVIFGTLVGACGWNIITWFFGLPTSSSHALIGGMIGAALVKTGPEAL